MKKNNLLLFICFSLSVFSQQKSCACNIKFYNITFLNLFFKFFNNFDFFEPHTPGGCTTCKVAITVNSGKSFMRNVDYDITAHASKFIPMGSVRIGSTISGNLHNVAFKTPTGKKVLLVVNDSNVAKLFNIKYNGKWITTSFDAGAVGTYMW